MTDRVEFYTICYIDKENQSLAENIGTRSFEEQVCIFVGCCETLSRSLKHYTGCTLHVFTNDAKHIAGLSRELDCIEVPFETAIPREMRFFSSMHRLDLFKHLGKRKGYSIFLDSDTVCLNPMPENLARCIEGKVPIYYDVTDQMYPAYSRERILQDKRRLSQKPSIGLWAGGELLGGNGNFFQSITAEIDAILGRYLADYASYFHQGDEMLVSCALERIMQYRYVCNVGSFGGIGRYWSIHTSHVQRPTSAFLDNFLLHLPADKPMLASYSLPSWIPQA